MLAVVGQPIVLSLKLQNTNTSKFVRAFIYDPDDNFLGSVDLTHIALGYFQDNTFVMPDLPSINAFFIVYDDAAYTIESAGYQNAEENFDASSFAQILAILDSMSGSGFDTDLHSLVEIRERLDQLISQINLASGRIVGKIKARDKIMAQLSQSEPLEAKLLVNAVRGSLDRQEVHAKVILEQQVRAIVKECE